MSANVGANIVRPLAGLGLVVSLLAVLAVSVGLVMDPDAKVKMRGVQVGSVESIAYRPDGTAALKLAMDPSQLHLIPSNVDVDIASSTVFGAKYVQMEAPAQPSAEALRKDQVLQGDHVTVEINTVFQQLTDFLDNIDPVKLNQTLGAIAQAFNGRGEKMGQTLTDFNALLGKLEPSLPNLARDIETTVPVLDAYADAAPDLMSAIDNTTRFGNTIVDEQSNLDQFLVSAIGLADIGNEVVGGNRQGLTELLHLLVPTTDLLYNYRKSIWCGIVGLAPFERHRVGPWDGNLAVVVPEPGRGITGRCLHDDLDAVGIEAAILENAFVDADP